MTAAVKLLNLKKAYNGKPILNIPQLEIREGEFVMIEGTSGSGKSTLLSMIGQLEQADQGEVQLFGNSTKPYTRKSEKLLKNEIGWLFQNYALADDRSVAFNLDMVLEEKDKSKRRALMQDALEKVDLADRMDAKICQLSGGEQQRVALARLLLKPCRLVLADEPTGNLDRENAAKIISLLQSMQKQGKTVLMVTHDTSFHAVASRIISLQKLSSPDELSLTEHTRGEGEAV